MFKYFQGGYCMHFLHMWSEWSQQLLSLDDDSVLRARVLFLFILQFAQQILHRSCFRLHSYLFLIFGFASSSTKHCTEIILFLFIWAIILRPFTFLRAACGIASNLVKFHPMTVQTMNVKAIIVLQLRTYNITLLLWKSLGHAQFGKLCFGGESIQCNITCV